MVHHNNKTATMLLQEFTVAYGFSRPEYDLVKSKTGTCTEFHFKVNVSNVCETGLGRSKKLAKQNAASKVLKLFADQGLYDHGSDHEFELQSHQDEFNTPLPAGENFIGILNDLCRKFHILHPQYKEIFNGGSLNSRKFIFECTIDSITTQGTANTKKKAKQLAAKSMLSAPNMAEMFVEKSNSLTDNDLRALEYYEKQPWTLNVKRCKKTLSVDHFPKALKNVMAKKNIKFEDFQEQFQNRNKEGLDYIFNVLHAEFKIQILQESPYIATALFNLAGDLDTNFTLMAIGSSKESATVNIIGDIYSILDMYLGIPDFDEDS